VTGNVVLQDLTPYDPAYDPVGPRPDPVGPLLAIAEYFGVHYSTVSRMVKAYENPDG
jgi:hypothetical protein